MLIIGGGLAGLVCAIRLLRKGIPCTLVEKKAYPFHRVCGEYISNEVRPFLVRENLFPEEINPAEINEFELSAINGKNVVLPLEMGGFGVSRYYFDKYLLDIALKEGLEIFREEATQIRFDNDSFEITTDRQSHNADILICAHGKRSKIDKSLNRAFIEKRSPYIGVKYHIRVAHPANRVALHNFYKGYCGINAIESGLANLCYLSHRDNLKKFKSIEELEENVLFRNPNIKRIFNEAEFLFDKPEVINEISFETKGPVEQHCLMIGDAAGMITPLNGNGMAMAIHSAYVLSELISNSFKGNDFKREELEYKYSKTWSYLFEQRLRKGRIMQKLFGNAWLSEFTVNLALHSNAIAKTLIRQSHGKEF